MKSRTRLFQAVGKMLAKDRRRVKCGLHLELAKAEARCQEDPGNEAFSFAVTT